MEIPATVPELVDRFPDDEACWASLKQVRWPQGFVSPRCEGRRALFLEARRLWQCRRCRKQVSLTAGAVLHGTRIPLCASGSWRSSSWPATRSGSRHCSSSEISASAATRRLGRCCTNCAPGSRVGPNSSCAARSKPTRPTLEALSQGCRKLAFTSRITSKFASAVRSRQHFW